MSSLRATCLCVVFGASLLSVIVCPPVKEQAKPQSDKEKQDAEMDLGLEYERYLKEVVSHLESDEHFKAKLQSANSSEIQSGEIAKHLNFVSHNIRSKLDELKRREIERLHKIILLQQHYDKGMKSLSPKLEIAPINKMKLLAHLDYQNPNSFDVEDLSRLIKQATSDLEDIDRRRKEDFKSYEMEKERQQREKLSRMNEEQRQAELQRLEEERKKHADHPKVNHPGNEEQLKEVWEEGDGLNEKDFDPRTFFFLHDTNGDGMWDEVELEALFQKELDKVYDPNNKEDDMVERYEEMNRMREHVMNEIDQDKNKQISLDEFLRSTRDDEFKKKEEWETLEKQKVYSEDELKQYQELIAAREEQMRREKMQEMMPPTPPNQDGNVQRMQQQQPIENVPVQNVDGVHQGQGERQVPGMQQPNVDQQQQELIQQQHQQQQQQADMQQPVMPVQPPVDPQQQQELLQQQQDFQQQQIQDGVQ